MIAPSRHYPSTLFKSAGLLVFVVFASLLFGAGDTGPLGALHAVLGQGSDEERFVVFELRWPRTLLGLLVGSALGVAGIVLQATTRNPLAEPGMLGVSAGASLAVVIAVAMGASSATVNLGVAVSGALGGCLLVLLVSRLGSLGDDPVRLILAGAAFSSLLAAFTSLILLHDQRSADEIRFWVIGALAGRSSDTLLWTLPGVMAGLVLLMPVVRPLASLALGERVAAGLGHHPQLTRFWALVAVAVLVGSATAAAGPIGFVGLIVPFVARRLVGPDIRRTLVPALLLGPCVLIAADIVSRLTVRPYELPIGVITAFIGAPILIAVVRRQRMPRL